MSMTLKDVKVGNKAVIVKVNGEGPIRRRLMDMGLTRHTEVFVKKVAPLGDPIEIAVRGYELTLRLEEAGFIEVEKTGDFR